MVGNLITVVAFTVFMFIQLLANCPANGLRAKYKITIAKGGITLS